MKKEKKINVINFPSKLMDGEREVEAILFAAAEPLDVDTIESKISKKINVVKILKKIESTYATRGINLVCISNKWSFRTTKNLSNFVNSSMLTNELNKEKEFLKKGGSWFSHVPLQK